MTILQNSVKLTSAHGRVDIRKLSNPDGKPAQLVPELGTKVAVEVVPVRNASMMIEADGEPVIEFQDIYTPSNVALQELQWATTDLSSANSSFGSTETSPFTEALSNGQTTSFASGESGVQIASLGSTPLESLRPVSAPASAAAFSIGWGTLLLGGLGLAAVAGAGRTSTTKDNTAPTLIVSDNVTGTANGLLTFTIQFSEDVTGFDDSKLSLSGGTLGSLVKVSDRQYTVLATPDTTPTGMLRLNVQTMGVTDAAGNQAVAPSVAEQAYAQTVLQGTIVAGPVVKGHSLSIRAFNHAGQALADAVVDAAGNYRVALGSHVGLVSLLVIDFDPTKPDYVDEFRKTSVDLSGSLLAAVTIGASDSPHTININPLTTVAALRAGLLVSDDGAGILPSSNASMGSKVDASNIAVAKAMGLGTTVADLLAAPIEPTVKLDGSTNASANKYGQILAVVSALDHENGGNSQATLLTLKEGISDAGRVSAAVLEMMTNAATTVDVPMDALPYIDEPLKILQSQMTQVWHVATGGEARFVVDTVGTWQVYRLHEFTDSDTLTLHQSLSVDYLVVGGGGAGGGVPGWGGGGGGGGSGAVLYRTEQTLLSTSYPVVVGSGGMGFANASGQNGGASSLGRLIAPGGGGGSGGGNSSAGKTGGSGGGGYNLLSAITGTKDGGGSSVSGQPGFFGNQGGQAIKLSTDNSVFVGGGGGGAGGVGGYGLGQSDAMNSDFSGSYGGAGGSGLGLSITGSHAYYGAGGGGGIRLYGAPGIGGLGGGGQGAVTINALISSPDAVALSGNGGHASGYGSGGGGAASHTGANKSGGNGSDGLVMVRYAVTLPSFQILQAAAGSLELDNPYRIVKYLNALEKLTGTWTEQGLKDALRPLTLSMDSEFSHYSRSRLIAEEVWDWNFSHFRSAQDAFKGTQMDVLTFDRILAGIAHIDEHESPLQSGVQLGAVGQLFSNATAVQALVDAGWTLEGADIQGLSTLVGSNTHDDLLDASQEHGLNLSFHGLGGDDVLIGGAGNDRLHGGAGNDTLKGGQGADVFIFQFSNEGNDLVTDFSLVEDDQLDFSVLLGANHPAQNKPQIFSSSAGPSGFLQITVHPFGGHDTVSVLIQGQQFNPDVLDHWIAAGVVVL